MGEMTKSEALEILRADNPRAPLATLAIYAAAFVEHEAAQANIDANGTIVFHPRTGAPITNPYLAVRNGAAAVMQKIRIASDRLWSVAAGANPERPEDEEPKSPKRGRSRA